MVRGVEEFKKHFSAYRDRYVLIGGTACTVVMEEVGLEFRATKDLDIVLVVEALNTAFVSAFWDFINKGGYQNRQRSTGKDVFYRFYSPSNKDFPEMLELFSRVPDFMKLSEESHLTPIPTSDATASLSAILLDEDYYNFTHSGKQEVDGLSVVEASHLIPLKARAWLDLQGRKQSGDLVNEKDIRKHKNDVFRLYRIYFKIRFLTKRKLPRFDDRKRSNINNMRPLTIVESRGFLKVKIPNLEVGSIYTSS